MIDLRRLRVLRSVAHYGTVTAAANALHFTPSAASQQIRQLGRDLGVTLLEPHGRRVQLTPAARRLLAHADAIEARWAEAEVDLLTSRDQPTGLLRVGAFPSAVSTLIAPIVAALRAQHPRLTVEVMETEPRSSFDLLFDGTLDLAVVEVSTSNPPVTDSAFDQRPLLEDVFDLVVDETHEFAGRTDIDLAEVATQPWIMAGPESSCHAHIISACTAAGFTPQAAHQALEWHAIAHLVAYGLGVALVPRLAYLAPHLPVVRVPLRGDPGPRRRLLTCTRSGGRDVPAVAAAAAELERIAPIVTERVGADSEHLVH